MARVNGQAIKASDYERQWLILKSLRPDSKPDEMTRRQVLEQMVKQQLLADEARKMGLDRDPSAAQDMDRQRDAVRAELMNAIQTAQAQLGQLDRAVEQKVLIDRLVDAKMNSIPLSGAELKKAYALRKAQLAPAPAPPFREIEGQLRRQLLIEKLVEEAKAGGGAVLYPDAAARARFE